MANRLEIRREILEMYFDGDFNYLRVKGRQGNNGKSGVGSVIVTEPGRDDDGTGVALPDLILTEGYNEFKKSQLLVEINGKSEEQMREGISYSGLPITNTNGIQTSGIIYTLSNSYVFYHMGIDVDLNTEPIFLQQFTFGKPIDVVEQIEFDFNTYNNTYNASGILLVKTMGNSMSDVLLTVSSINRVANHIVYLPVKRRLEDGEIVNLITPMLLVLNNILASGRSIFKLSFMSSPSERLTRYPLYVEAGVVGKMVCEMCTNAYV